MRRIKSIALSIPSVVGPYTSLNCTLSLLKSTVRKSPVGEDYAREGAEDPHFVDYVGSIQAIVTSGGNNDSGMFETNLKEERFLPFEGAGAISTWRLELPSEFRPFDYSTISDVILHIRYTARDGGKALAQKATESLRMALEDAKTSGQGLLFSLRQDFPTEYAAFTSSKTKFSVKLRKDYFPYMVQSETITVNAIDLFTVEKGELKPASVDLTSAAPDVGGLNDGPVDLSLDAGNLKGDAAQGFLKGDAAQAFVIVRYSV
jgi:hypothetical protein